LFLI
jgi:ankyrin repeat protein